jgi:hypothetical protein
MFGAGRSPYQDIRVPPEYKISKYKARKWQPASPDVGELYSFSIPLMPITPQSYASIRLVKHDHTKASAVTTHTLLLTSRRGISISRRYLQALHLFDQKSRKGAAHTAPITSAAKDNVYLVPIRFGEQSFLSVLDTGSSDTWLVGADYECIDLFDRRSVADSECRFGPLYNSSRTFKRIPNQHFNISYADGEFLNGIMGREDVTLAGMTVPQQIVGVVDYAAWMGDLQSSGLVGLAYPSITRAYPGNDTKSDRKSANIAYSPIFTSMTRLNLTAPLFSIALGRDGKPGVVAFGGLPGSSVVRYSSNFARANIEFLSMATEDGTIRQQTEYQMYTITADSFSFATKKSKWSRAVSSSATRIETGAPRTQVIIDSGTTLLFLPPGITKTVNALWSPPAHYNEDSQTYFVHCTATAPRFGVTIDGQTFWVDPKDLVLDAGVGERVCMSGIQPGSDGVSVLGDVFLKTVLAVFDVGAGEMRFAARK